MIYGSWTPPRKRTQNITVDSSRVPEHRWIQLHRRLVSQCPQVRYVILSDPVIFQIKYKTHCAILTKTNAEPQRNSAWGEQIITSLAGNVYTTNRDSCSRHVQHDVVRIVAVVLCATQRKNGSCAKIFNRCDSRGSCEAPDIPFRSRVSILGPYYRRKRSGRPVPGFPKTRNPISIAIGSWL